MIIGHQVPSHIRTRPRIMRSRGFTCKLDVCSSLSTYFGIYLHYTSLVEPKARRHGNRELAGCFWPYVHEPSTVCGSRVLWSRLQNVIALSTLLSFSFPQPHFLFLSVETSHGQHVAAGKIVGLHHVVQRTCLRWYFAQQKKYSLDVSLCLVHWNLCVIKNPLLGLGWSLSLGISWKHAKCCV